MKYPTCIFTLSAYNVAVKLFYSLLIAHQMTFFQSDLRLMSQLLIFSGRKQVIFVDISEPCPHSVHWGINPSTTPPLFLTKSFVNISQF